MAEPPALAPPSRAHELRRSTTPPPRSRRPLPKTPLMPVVKPAPASKPPPRGAPPPTPPRVATAKPEPPPRLARPSQPGSTTHLAAPPVVVTVAPASPLPSPAAAPPQKERQAKRVYIAKEICTTEENYVGNLSDLITLFKQPIEASGLLTPEQVRAMFGNAEALAGLHQTLLSELKERMAKFDDNACIADVICRLIPYMKLYTEYINSFDHAQETLATALKHSDFAEHLEKLGSASFRGHIGLSSLALTPVLRIPRYVLLLQDLKKNTPEAHPDYPNICLAFEKASVMAQYINETKRRDERRRRMVAIAGRLKGDVECLRYCLVQDPQSVRQHVWGAHKKFFVLTKCEVCGNLMGLLSEEGVECNDCQLAVHVKCQADAPERCGPRPEPTILAHFRRLLLDGKARHRIFRPKAANTGRDSKRESSDFKWRDAIVAIFNDAILIAIPESASDDKSPLIISGWLPWHNRARTHNLEIADTPDSLSFSLVCPRTLDTHMLEFDAQPAKKEWLDEIRQAMKDWSTNVNQALLAPVEAEPEVAKQPPAFHASQVLPKDQLLRPQAAIASVTFQIPATLPVFDAKEDKEFTAYVVEARIVDSNGAASDVSLMKRYSQFDELHSALEKRYKKALGEKGVKFPELPKKRWFGNTDPDFVKKRCMGLAQYLAAVAAVDDLMKSEELHKFLRTSLDSRAPAEDSKEKDEGDSDPSPRTSRAGSLENFNNPRSRAGSDTSLAVPAAAAAGGASPALPPRPQRARALYDFVATGATELSLKAGDVVDLHDTSDQEWWYGALHGTEGYFPAAYVEREH